MGSSSSNSDQLSQLSRAVSTTASAIFGSQTMEDTILSYSSPYKKLLHQTITHSGSSNALTKLRTSANPFKKEDNKAFQDIYSAANGRSFFENQFSNTKTSFRVLSYLSEELLYDIPSSGKLHHSRGRHSKKFLKENGEDEGNQESSTTPEEPSLFQGFESSLPTIDEMITTGPRAKTALLENGENSANDANANFSLPAEIDWDEVNTTNSLSVLKAASQTLLDGLDLLEIQKNLAASEIKEIDSKLERLKMVRELIFKRVARVDQNEIFYEKHLAVVRQRLDLVEANELDSQDSVAEEELSEQEQSNTDIKKDLQASPAKHSHDAGNESDEDESTSALMSKSIYQKVRSRHERRGSRTSKSSNLHNGSSKNKFHSGNRRRKTYPTLQQFYEPGSKILALPQAHDDGITCLDFDMPFGTMSTAGKLDHCVKIWNLSKGTQTGSLSGHLASVSCMQMDESYTLVTGGRDALLKVWDIERAEEVFQEQDAQEEDQTELCLHTFDAHVDEITALHFEGSTLVSGSQDRTIRQWDLYAGKCVQTIDIDFTNRGTSTGLSSISSQNPSSNVLLTHNEPPVIGALQFYDAAMATGTKDGVVRLWDLRSGQVVRALEGHTDAITGLQFDSVNLVTGSLDRSIRIWDLRTGLLADVFAYDRPIGSLEFDFNKIVAADNENCVRIYDRKDGRKWKCGDEEGDAAGVANSDTSLVEVVRYKNGYLIEGRTDGTVNTWAI
ncbi:LAFA_0F01882g1_1 [Lachancea sp. 'fantastica']|nr:LAFA_0F01882g1_1 [Lachancea sp. 'fantastica']